MPAIHQFVAGFTHGDAISNEALVLQQCFRSWGARSDIFSEPCRILPELRGTALDVEDFAASACPEDAVLLHLSIGSRVNDVFASLPCRKAILYHNVTPSHYFELVNARTAQDLARGRRQMESLAGSASIVLADSAYNARELEAAGYTDVAVLPLVVDFDVLDTPPDRRVAAKFDDGLVNVLFVGRCAPNKRIEDVLTAFAAFHRHVEPRSRLIHVGSFAGTERYYYLLLALVRELGLDNVHFARSVPQRQLNTFYQVADLFLCMSEHEGFCIPLLEAMHHGVPVLAYAAGAVPETMGGAGVLFKEKQFEVIAETMGSITRDAALRSALVREQHRRVAMFRDRDTNSEVKACLGRLMA